MFRGDVIAGGRERAHATVAGSRRPAPMWPAADEQAQLARARAGDFTGFSVRDGHGTWTTL
jgi:hypothetical protein